MYKKVTNPIAMQSQKHICETMLHLLTQMPFDDITITLLCQEAHHVRKTFYRNFETKEDVLICMLDYDLLEYMEELKDHLTSIEDFIEHFLTYWHKKYNYLKVLQENALFYLLNRLYLHYISNLQEIITGSNLSPLEGHDGYSIVLYYGALCNVLAFWFSRECIDSIEALKNFLLFQLFNIS